MVSQEIGDAINEKYVLEKKSSNIHSLPKFSRRGVYAHRKFPPGCGLSGSPLLSSKNGNVGISNHSYTVVTSGCRPRRSLDSDLSKDECVRTNDAVSSEKKPAVRDFPPLCGRHTLRSSKMPNSENNLVVSRKMTVGEDAIKQESINKSCNMVEELCFPLENANMLVNGQDSEGPINSGSSVNNGSSSRKRKTALSSKGKCFRNYKADGKMENIMDDSDEVVEKPICTMFGNGNKMSVFDVNLPPVLGTVQNDILPRSKVKEMLRTFHAICRKLLQAKESNPEVLNGRIDLKAASLLKEKGKCLSKEKIVGSVPGIEIGDEFQFRIELNMVGLHRPIQGGIDFVKKDGKALATSIVASGCYDDDMDDSDILIYSGQGGNIIGGDKEPEDQKLENGNLALKLSFEEKNPVRVIRGYIVKGDCGNMKTYVYDGLYTVEKWWQELSHHGKVVFKYKLVRIPDQPHLPRKIVTKSKKFKVREGLCLQDISDGKELVPIRAINTIDNERPAKFEYITRLIYPNSILLTMMTGCGCINGCKDGKKCSCIRKNGGELPYNHDGSVVESKTIIYECGPSCKCPPSCYNRVSQHGIKFQLEIFKTGSRGWGVRSLNFIPSGGFVCEYLGQLLEEKEAEELIGNDEYLFDIGNYYDTGSLIDDIYTVVPTSHDRNEEIIEDGFTIDAHFYGNIGRFINHSCSPNLYAQNVFYDHQDKRFPHIMFFAAENIPPLQELSYNYHYAIDQVRDSNGNIRRKECYCGTPECIGRMY